MDKLRLAIQSQLGGRMVSMPSTLVETVSINYEDFNESFLTCGTCLCTYDGGEHTPKLLPCSHTVCRHCLERIANSQTRDVGTFRCPICRECITIPRGGVSALPPSFLVNQLLDLMSRQRREVIPKCSIHTNQDLLFCETCDIVFCTKCKGSNHNSSGDLCQHTVIPFSLAIKRMSEILLYKANECISKLNEASDNITEEMERLDHNVDHAFESISNSFQDIMNLLEKRRQDMIMKVKCIREEKRKVLLDQLAAVRSEKEKVDQEIESLQYEVEVRNISKKISDLECKLDNVAYLSDPKENSFLSYECDNNSCLEQFRDTVNTIGRVRTSRTFPPNCTLSVDSPIAHLKCRAKVRTFDYHGLPRTSGGDPISVKLWYDQLLIPVEITDEEDGTYSIWFLPDQPGCYSLDIQIFNRPIKNQPFSFQATNHHSPIQIIGKRGLNEDGFMQPVGLAADSGKIYVADTGNCRIKVMDSNFQFERAFENDVLKGKSVTGIAMSPSGNIIIVNWRTSTVAELDLDGAQVNKFSHPDLVEPTNVTVNALGHIIVADNYSSSVFLFDDNGKLIKKFGSKGKNPGQFDSISAVQTGQNDDIIVADSRLQVFDCKGGFVREIYPEGKGKGQFGGVTYDGDDRIICSRIEKNKTFLMVFSYSGAYLFTIDSFESKLRRPSGLVTSGDKTVIVADLGNDCLKQYRYA